MAFVNIRLTFDRESDKPWVYERGLDIPNLREDGGREFLVQHLFSELAKDSGVGRYFADLPSVDNFLREVTQAFQLEDIFSGSFEDRVNARAMWIEIGRTLLRVKHLLAQSRSYADQERIHSTSQEPEAVNLACHFHRDKMERFDYGVTLLGKVSDLTARLVFERLGASLLPKLDKTNPEWERALTWATIRQALADRNGNSHVASLTDAEYSALMGIFEDFLQTDHGTRLWAYRVRLTHRVTPSVDRPELYTHLDNREMTPIPDAAGNVKGWTKGIGGSRITAEYSFADLYGDAVQTLRHYVAILERLEAIPRFSLEGADESPKAAAQNGRK